MHFFRFFFWISPTRLDLQTRCNSAEKPNKSARINECESWKTVIRLSMGPIIGIGLLKALTHPNSQKDQYFDNQLELTLPRFSKIECKVLHYICYHRYTTIRCVKCAQ